MAIDISLKSFTGELLRGLPSFSVAAVILVAVVLFHYEMLQVFSRIMNRLRKLRRVTILILIFGLLSAHIVEIWLYAVGYYLISLIPGSGSFAGLAQPTFLDLVYFSSMTYTTVGYGDIVPNGPIRFTAALEALSGLVLITWSASFTYLEMERFWRER